MTTQTQSAFDCSSDSRPGRASRGNGDTAAVAPEIGVFIVADGISGHRGSAEASSTAVRAFLERMRLLAPAARIDEAELRRAVAEASAAVIAAARADAGLTGMGTTLSAAVIAGSDARIVHVGDSRIYLFRAGRLACLTRDHTLVAELVGRGDLAAEDVPAHPLRHVLSRSLGTREAVEPDIADLHLQRGDLLILATDGVTEVLADAALAQILAERGTMSAKATSERIMQSVEAGAPSDDFSVAVVRLADIRQREKQ